MDIVDTQVHFNRVGSLDAALAAMDALGITSALYDESIEHHERGRDEPAHILPNGAVRPVGPRAEAAATLYPDRFGVMRRVNYRDPDLDAVVKVLSAAPYTKVLRIVVFAAEELSAFANGEYEQVFETAGRYGLPLVVLIPGHIDLLHRYAGTFSDLNIVIDHCGTPLKKGAAAPHLDAVLEFGRYRNVALKWAHAPYLLSGAPYPFADVIPLLKRALSAFGPERIMWGSDYTLTAAHFSWAEALFYLRNAGDLSAGEREWILGRTARTIFRWPLKAK